MWFLLLCHRKNVKLGVGIPTQKCTLLCLQMPSQCGSPTFIRKTPFHPNHENTYFSRFRPSFVSYFTTGWKPEEGRFYFIFAPWPEKKLSIQPPPRKKESTTILWIESTWGINPRKKKRESKGKRMEKLYQQFSLTVNWQTVIIAMKCSFAVLRQETQPTGKRQTKFTGKSTFPNFPVTLLLIHRAANFTFSISNCGIIYGIPHRYFNRLNAKGQPMELFFLKMCRKT